VKVAKDPSRFGRGAIEGVTSPEAANNACDQTSFIPTMTLGIPQSAVMALMLGALMIHGITPGPNLLTEKPEMFWGLVMSFWIGNVMLLALNLPLIGIWIRLLQIPFHILMPGILMFICIGAYAINNTVFDVYLVLVFGALGYAMRLADFPPAPLILGFVLGPMMEENLRRALLISRGDFLVFLTRPISAVLVLVTVALVAWAIWSAIRGSRPAVLKEAE
jgi:TctA family transporter